MAKKIIDELSLEQKARLVSGVGMWWTMGYEQPPVPSVRMNDGPHGLRVQDEEDVRNINQSNIATCFPTACASACSWDENLLYQMGEAIAEEALAEKVSTVLGPGVNIKRSPLCGRNFEYFSEDPFLAGRLAAAWINGVQSKKVGTSLKHFAVNGQEKRRMTIDTLVDERALREIYLSAFEYAVVNSQPTSVMAAYNKVNGTYCTQNKYLQLDILRNEWGFNGIVVSDWGATNDIVECIRNGMDLEMPDSLGHGTKKILKAVEDGVLTEAELDRAVANMLKFVTERSKCVKNFTADLAKNHIIAKEIETESAVLLKNDGALPLDSKTPVLVVGALAEKMRYQGSGSSHINTAVTPNIIDALKFNNVKIDYAKGYKLASDEESPDLVDEVMKKAKNYDTVIFCGGLTESCEGEGYDRDNLNMPECQNKLISKLAKAGKKIVVVLFGGSPMLMPWLNEVNAVLNMYLGGQAVGEAAQELLYGIKNPCGKLAESYPQKLSDTPCFNYYANKKLSVELRESVFVGYRYYDTFETPTMFDFGYGLSYTSFDYSNLKITKNNLHNYTVEVTVKNTGKTAGKEIVQLYITAPNGDTMRPKRELKGFAKTDLLKPNESQKLEFHLDKRSFALYSPEKKDWVVGEGEYTVEISASLNNVKQSKTISVEGEKLPNQRKTLPAYFDQTGKTFTIPDDQFEELSGRKIIIDRNFTRGEFTTNSTLEQLQKYSLLAKIIVRISKKVAYKSVDGDINSPVYKMSTYGAMETPLHTLPAMTNNMVKMKIVRAVVDFANGRFFKGLGDLLGKDI